MRRPSGPACDIGAYEVAAPRVNAILAQAIGARSVKILVTLTANAGRGTAWVQYGRTKAYGHRSMVSGVGGVTPVAASIVLRGLDLRRTYHYRVVVSTIDGMARTGDMTLAVPALRLLRIIPSSFARGRGATVSYIDSRAGVTTFAVQRRVRRRWITVATFAHRDRAGRDSVRFGRRLIPGVYRLKATPRNGRTRGLTVSARFRIVS